MSRFFSARLSGLQTYVPGEQPQDMQYIKLNTNESPYPPSDGVIAAVDAQQVRDLRLYPDPEGRILTQKLADLYGVKPENIFLSNGSDEVLSFAFMAFCDGSHGAVYPDITYGFYPVFSALYGIDGKQIPLRPDFSVDIEAYTHAGRMIVLANPNAPTGLLLDVDQIEYLVRHNRDSVVVIDEAYIDFGGQSCYPLIQKYDNLLVVRTYSKSRCMAGARLGFAFGSRELIEDLTRIKFSTNPYNINRLTLVAGAAAVDDDAYYQQHCRQICQTRQKTADRLAELGFEQTASQANFLFARHPSVSGELLYRQLKENGILVRRFDRERISEFLRITIGTPEQMEQFCTVISRLIP